MTTIHTNRVNILVYGEDDQPLDLFGPFGSSRWKIEFGTPVVSKGEAAKDDPLPYWNHSATGNQIEIEFDAGRHRETAVATSYVNAGYQVQPPLGDDWPSQGVGLSGGGALPSANMSVHGEFSPPQEMNFYFPLTITTPQFYQMNLLLGQTGTGHGWVQLFKDLAADVADNFESCVEAEEGDEPEATENAIDALQESADIVNDIVDLLGSNPWYVTVIGSQDHPAAIIPAAAVDVVGFVGVLGTGTPVPNDQTSPPVTPTGKQAFCFYYDPKHGQGDYTFKLKVFNERLP